MPRQRTFVPVIFNKGLNTGADPKLVTDGFLRLENVVVPRDGHFAKRNGFLDAENGEKCTTGGEFKDNFVGVSPTDSRFFHGQNVLAEVEDISGPTNLLMAGNAYKKSEINIVCANAIAGTDAQQYKQNIDNVDVYNDGTYGIVVWRDGTKLLGMGFAGDYSRFGDVVTLAASTGVGRPIKVGSNYFVVVVDTSQSTGSMIRYSQLNTTTLRLASTSAFANQPSSDFEAYSFDVISLGNTGFCAFSEDGLTNQMKLHPMVFDSDATDTWGTAITKATYSTAGSFGITCWLSSDETNAYVCYHYESSGAGTQEYNVVSYDSSATIDEFSDTNIFTGLDPRFNNFTGYSTGSSAFKVLGELENVLKIYTYSGSGSTSTNGCDFTLRSQLSSDGYCWVAPAPARGAVYSASTDDTGNSYLLFDANSLSIIGVAGHQISYNKPSEEWLPKFLNNTTVLPIASDEISSDFGFVDISTPVNQLFEFGGVLISANGILQRYDGKTFTHIGFPMRPRVAYLSGYNTGDGAEDGTYYYLYQYERRDAAGNVDRSPVSNPAVDASTGSAGYTISSTEDGIKLEIPSPSLSWFDEGNVTLKIYRSKKDSTSIYKLVETVDILAESVESDGCIDVVDTIGSTADDDLMDEQLNYSVLGAGGSGKGAPMAMFPCSVARPWRGRLFGVDDTYPDSVIYYSKTLSEEPGIQFTSTHAIELDPDGDPITALYPLKDKLLIFKQNSIFVTYGEGLNEFGGGTNYVKPYKISDSVGCVNNDSVVGYPGGVMFRSDLGIYNINDSLQVTYSGHPVQEWLNLQTNEGNAVNWEKEGLIIFGDKGSNKNTLVFDYVRGIWCVWKIQAVMLAVANDLLFFTDGTTMHYSNSSGYADDGSAIEMVLDTGHIPVGGLLAGGRIKRMIIFGHHGSTGDTTDLSVQAQFDYATKWHTAQVYDSDTTATDFTFAQYFADSPSPSEDDNAFIVDCVFDFIRASAIRVRIKESSSAAPFAITGIMFEFLVDTRMFYTDSSRRLT